MTIHEENTTTLPSEHSVWGPLRVFPEYRSRPWSRLVMTAVAGCLIFRNQGNWQLQSSRDFGPVAQYDQSRGLDLGTLAIVSKNLVTELERTFHESFMSHGLPPAMNSVRVHSILDIDYGFGAWGEVGGSPYLLFTFVCLSLCLCLSLLCSICLIVLCL